MASDDQCIDWLDARNCTTNDAAKHEVQTIVR